MIVTLFCNICQKEINKYLIYSFDIKISSFQRNNNSPIKCPLKKAPYLFCFVDSWFL